MNWDMYETPSLLVYFLTLNETLQTAEIDWHDGIMIQNASSHQIFHFIIQLIFLQQYFPIPIPCNITRYCTSVIAQVLLHGCYCRGGWHKFNGHVIIASFGMCATPSVYLDEWSWWQQSFDKCQQDIVSLARLSHAERVWWNFLHWLVSNTPRISWLRINWLSDELGARLPFLACCL